uniref:Uncharacterized protein n=1 Tax=Rhizophora mucronata TaxID=61149 RepID=A0A2P2IHR7_RHIMU
MMLRPLNSKSAVIGRIFCGCILPSSRFTNCFGEREKTEGTSNG